MRILMRSILPVVFVFVACSAYAQDNHTCQSCHSEDTAEGPVISFDEFNSSVHGQSLCVSCHVDAEDLPHPEDLAPVSCAQCHRIETNIYLSSDHGRALSRGNTESATCTSCHGYPHAMLSSRIPASPIHRKNIPKTCGTCHADEEKMAKYSFSMSEPFGTYLVSVHGKALDAGRLNAAVCSDCHGTHDLLSASNPKSTVYRSSIPATCGQCHSNVRKVYERSIHGKAMEAGIMESAVCTDCHGEHTLFAVSDPASSVWVGTITETCSRCHESEKIVKKFGLPADRLRTYEESFHGLAARGGDLRVANCASCHGWHDILPSYDTLSSVNHKNLRFVCGKCHPGAQARRIEGPIHGGEGVKRHFLINFAQLFYYTLIPLLIGFMVIHTFSDYLRKALSAGIVPTEAQIMEKEHAASIMRLTVNERIQHAVLVLTFIVLAYSGFALEYSEAWWAAPFAAAGGETVRRAIHRWTALCLVLLGVYHLIYMFATRRGRDLILKQFRPVPKDLKDLALTTAYNLGLRKEKPQHSYPSYIEKMEYWALIWGSIVMLTTGSLLVFSDLTIRFFPLWVTDLATYIHFYEAVLACLAILVWHFYWAIFDPDVYPMNWAWIFGKLRRKTTDVSRRS